MNSKFITLGLAFVAYGACMASSFASDEQALSCAVTKKGVETPAWAGTIAENHSQEVQLQPNLQLNISFSGNSVRVILIDQTTAGDEGEVYKAGDTIGYVQAEAAGAMTYFRSILGGYNIVCSSKGQ